MDERARVGQRRIHTGRVLNLDIDTVRFPDGSEGELEVIRHPGASAVVPLMDYPTSADPRVVLIRQYRYAAGGYVYEVPAGRLNEGEDPRDCAQRELEEEAGYRATHIRPLISILTTPGFTDERIHLFVAWSLAPVTARHERDEFISAESTSLRQAVEMIDSGAIVDAKTAIALLMTQRFIAQSAIAPDRPI